MGISLFIFYNRYQKENLSHEGEKWKLTLNDSDLQPLGQNFQIKNRPESVMEIPEWRQKHIWKALSVNTNSWCT